MRSGRFSRSREIGRLCKRRGVLFHTDAVQAAGKIPLDVDEMGIDLLSLSAHKMYGPKGVGALYVRRREPHVRLEPQIDGGGHERGLRSGTLPVPLIVGFGAACELCRSEMAEEAERLRALRERLRAGIQGQLEDMVLHGHPTERLPGNLNLGFAYIDSGRLDDEDAGRGGQLRVGVYVGQRGAEPRVCGRSASRTSWPTAASATAWAGSRRRTKWTTPSRRRCGRCSICGRSARSTRCTGVR